MGAATIAAACVSSPPAATRHFFAATGENQLTPGSFIDRSMKNYKPTNETLIRFYFSHNEARDAGEPDWEKKHELDRSTVSELVCALCETRQPVGVACANMACGTAFGAYACAACPFFDDDLSKGTFHCEECGICRVGGCAVRLGGGRVFFFFCFFFFF
jgi:hypothetical protein